MAICSLNPPGNLAIVSIFVVFSPSNSALGADDERWVRHVFKRTPVCDGSGCAANTR